MSASDAERLAKARENVRDVEINRFSAKRVNRRAAAPVSSPSNAPQNRLRVLAQTVEDLSGGLEFMRTSF